MPRCSLLFGVASLPVAHMAFVALANCMACGQGLKPEFMCCSQDDLTFHDAEERFHELLDRAQTESERERMRACIIASRLPGWSLKRARVGGSLIAGAGNGVFALRALEMGELVTFYPGDLRLRWQPSIHGIDLAEEQLGSGYFSFAEHLPLARRDALRRALLNTQGVEVELDVVPVTPEFSVAGDPELLDNQAYLGHVLNDCATCSTVDDVAEYVISAATRANCRHTSLADCHTGTVTTRRVEAGEELYVTYGPTYWLGRQDASDAELQEALDRWRDLKFVLGHDE